MANPAPGVNAGFLAALDRLEIGYAYDDHGQYVLTDAFISAGMIAAVGRVCDNYGIELAIADSVLTARRKGLAAVHLNHHPYVHVV